eukprot:scaffold98398_cov24-Phaeocystis_antarctica.AAC.1
MHPGRHPIHPGCHPAHPRPIRDLPAERHDLLWPYLLWTCRLNASESLTTCASMCLCTWLGLGLGIGIGIGLGLG